MKHRIFYISDEKLIEYLKKYGRGANSKDYEFSVSLHAKSFWERKLKQKLSVVFEQNDKMHDYPQQFSPTLEDLKEILRTYNKEDTPIDFALAPISSEGDFIGLAYPFQIKKFMPNFEDDLSIKFAEFINKKTNSYRDNDLCMIFLPIIPGIKENSVGFKIQEIKDNLKIDENSVRAIYCFQFSKGTPSFSLLWASQKTLESNNF